jgi:putative nucleotidyltransferase with HDIG domain
MPDILTNMSQPNSDLPRILRQINQLRPLPVNVTHLLRALDSPAVSVGVVSDYIAMDQALAAYILRVVNSVSLGYSSSCSSLRDAVVRLGFKRIRSLVLNTFAAGPLTRRLMGYGYGNGQLWNHSLLVANFSRWLAQAFSYPDPEEAYVAGLLHDMGKLVLDQFVAKDYDQIYALVNAHNLTFWEIEHQFFGIDHAGVGGLMATRWGFPESLSQAIQYHHSPAKTQNKQKLTAIVTLADDIAPKNNIVDPTQSVSTFQMDTVNILQTDIAKVENLCKKMLQYFSTAGIGPQPPSPRSDEGLPYG